MKNLDLENLVKWTFYIVIVAIIFLIVVVSLYFVKIDGPFLSDPGILGQFGDYIGGTLNPLFSFLALIILVLTLALQSRQLELAKKEVEYSKKELELTRKELEKSSEAQILTAQSLAKQTEFIAISAELSALNSAFSVTSEIIDQMQKTTYRPQGRSYEDYVSRKEDIARKIFEITDRLN